MKAEIICDAAKFDSLRSAWQSLAAQAASSPFQQFEWLQSWMNTVGRNGYSIRVAVLREGGALRAVMPMTVRKYNGVRLLEWMAAKASDYNDVLIDLAVDAREACVQLWKCMQREAGFDAARFGQVRTDAKIYAFLDARKPWIETKEVSIGIKLAESSAAEWLAARSAKTREQINYGLRRMKRNGFEYHVCDASEDLTPFVDALIGQKRAWLKARNMQGLVSDDAGEEFVRAAVSAAANNGTLHLSAIRSAEHIAACHFGFRQAGVLYYYMPSYDPQFSKYSFGNLLRESLIMWACDRQFHSFDMLLGEHEYKSHYETVCQPVRTLVLPRTVVGRLAVAAYRFKSSRSVQPVAQASE